MAVRSNFLNEEDQKAIAPSTPSSGVFTATAATGTPSPNQAATPTSEPGKGTGFTNLEKYLQQNTGSQAGAIKAIGQQAGESQYQTELGQATGAYQKAAAESEAATAKKAGELSSGLQTKPMETATQAGEFLGESYAGPKADPYQAQIKAAEQAQAAKLGMLGTASGQQDALQEAFKGEAGYGKGFSALDQFLIAGNPQARGALEAQTKEQEQRMKSAGQQAGTALSEQQKATEEKFKQQQASVKSAAKAEQEKRAKEATTQIEKKEAQNIALPGYQRASYGDVLSEPQIAELQALSELSGEPIENLRAKTFKPGTIPESKGGFEQQAPGKMPKADTAQQKLTKEFDKLKNRLGI